MILINNAKGKSMQSISMIGCGWLGRPTGKKLSDMGFRVYGSTRTTEKKDLLRRSSIIPAILYHRKDALFCDTPEIFNSDAFIFAIPPGRSDDSVIEYPRLIAKIAEKIQKGKKVVFVSTTAVYSDDEEFVDESSLINPQRDSGKAVYAAELEILNRFPQAVILRMAGLVGADRHPGRFLANKPDAGNPELPVNLIHLDDAVKFLIRAVTDANMHGVFNVCTPIHPKRGEFYTAAAKHLRIGIPHFTEGAPGKRKVVVADKILQFTDINLKYENPMSMFDPHSEAF